MLKRMFQLLALLLLLAALVLGVLLHVASGALPSGDRLARCRQSPQWHGDSFANRHLTPSMTGKDPLWKQILKFLFRHPPNLRPSAPVPAVKIDLGAIPRNADAVVWLGHSSIYLQTAGLRLLFDPVLTARLPVTLFLRPFPATCSYTPADIPPLDALVITHDHWDHLDWLTVRALRDRVPLVVCPLGVGAHFERWGFPPEKIRELDWHDSVDLSPSVTLRCLPSRHFSGRLFKKNRSLWASFLVDGPRRVFVSGDGGYDSRFARIGRDYPNIDLAILENGQYDPGWRYIHTSPEELPRAADDLSPRLLLTCHNSRYTIANHPWTEPLTRILAASPSHPWHLLTPLIGAPVSLSAPPPPPTPWWPTP